MSGSHGSLRPLLDHVAPHQTRVVGGPAGDDHHPPEVSDLGLGEPDVFEDEPPVADTLADRLGHRLRLLVDLLEHEGLVALLLGRLVVPVDVELLSLHRLSGEREERRPVLRDRDDLAVLDQLHAASLPQERGDRRGQEHLALADPDDERTLVAGTDEESWMIPMHDHESEMALQLRVRGTHRFDEIPAVVPLDQMDDGLGVGLRGEHMPVLLERLLQLAVVLDDSVEHDRDLILGRAGQRMRVLDRDAPVGRPAGVADADPRVRAVRSGCGLELVEVADRPHVVEPVRLEQAKTGGVVAAVLETLETAKQQILRGPVADISDDPAHSVCFPLRP